MDTLFTQDVSPALIFGVGALGCMAAKYAVENRDQSAAAWSVAHTNATELISTGLERKLFLKIPDGPFASRHLERSLNESAATLEKLARGRHAAILCGELSDNSAIQIIEALSAALDTRSIRVVALLIEPFTTNGASDASATEGRERRLSASVPAVALLNAGMENISAGVAATRIRKMAAERLACASQCLEAALNADCEQGERLRTLRGPHRASFGFSEHGGGAAQSSAAFDAALAPLDAQARARVDAVMLTSCAEISFRESRAIVAKLPAHAAVIATTSDAFDGRAACLLFSANENAANVVSIEAAFEPSPPTPLPQEARGNMRLIAFSDSP